MMLIVALEFIIICGTVCCGQRSDEGQSEGYSFK